MVGKDSQAEKNTCPLRYLHSSDINIHNINCRDVCVSNCSANARSDFIVP